MTRIIVPGPILEAAQLDSVEKFWDLLFNREIIEIIVENTNFKIEETRIEMTLQERIEQTYHGLTDPTEIRSLIAVLYYAGFWKQSTTDETDLWSRENGTSFYRCIMTKKRFSFLLNNLRFDCRETRDSDDRFAPIRSIWEIFILTTDHIRI